MRILVVSFPMGMGHSVSFAAMVAVIPGLWPSLGSSWNLSAVLKQHIQMYVIHVFVPCDPVEENGVHCLFTGINRSTMYGKGRLNRVCRRRTEWENRTLRPKACKLEFLHAMVEAWPKLATLVSCIHLAGKGLVCQTCLHILCRSGPFLFLICACFVPLLSDAVSLLTVLEFSCFIQMLCEIFLSSHGGRPLSAVCAQCVYLGVCHSRNPYFVIRKFSSVFHTWGGRPGPVLVCPPEEELPNIAASAL